MSAQASFGLFHLERHHQPQMPVSTETLQNNFPKQRVNKLKNLLPRPRKTLEYPSASPSKTTVQTLVQITQPQTAPAENEWMQKWRSGRCGRWTLKPIAVNKEKCNTSKVWYATNWKHHYHSFVRTIAGDIQHRRDLLWLEGRKNIV